MKPKVELNFEQYAAIVIDSLKEDYEYSTCFSEDDLNYDKKFIKAVRRLLKYYMTEKEYRDYMDGVNSDS